MRTIWHSLFWKEWHEHKWKLASLGAILLCLVLLSARFEHRFDFPSTISSLLVSYTLIASFFIATGAAAGERSRGTLPFLQAMPEPPWKTGLVKLISAVLTVVLPALAMLGVLYLISGTALGNWLIAPSSLERDKSFAGLLGIQGWFTVRFAVLAFVPLSITLWTAAAGVNSSSEVRAAVLALLAIVVVWFGFINLLIAVDHWHLGLRVLGWPAAFLLGAMPGGILLVRQNFFQWPTNFAAPSIAACLGFLLVHFALAAWYLTRFAKRGGNSVFSPRESTLRIRSRYYLRPFRTSLTAALWKQFRESGALGITGLAGIYVFAGFAAIWMFFATETPTRARHVNLSELIAQMLYVMSLCIGSVTVLIIGVGAFFYELEPRLHEFWRSRPIHPRLWFWTKYLIGLAVVLLLLNLPLGTALILLNDSQLPEHNLLEYLCLLAGEIAFYSTAVALTCLVRRAVYASILSIGAVAIVAASIEWFVPRPSMYFLTFICCSGAAATTTLAWFSLKHDWGWHR